MCSRVERKRERLSDVRVGHLALEVDELEPSQSGS